MSLIRKKEEVSVQPLIKMLIYGASGSGKTTLALSAPRPLLFDTDNGFYRTNEAHWAEGTIQCSESAVQERVQEIIKRGETPAPEDYLFGIDLINHIIDNEDLSMFDTFVIDTFGKLLDYMSESIAIANKGNLKLVQRDGSLAIGGYGVLKTMFATFCRKITSKGKHLVFVAHDKDATIKGAEFTKKIVSATGGSYNDVKTELDMVMYLGIQNEKRILFSQPSELYDSKNSIGLTNCEIPICVDPKTRAGLSNNFLSERVITPYVSYINSIKTQVSEFHSKKEEILKLLSGVADAESANSFMEDVLIDGGSFVHAGASKAFARTQFSVKANTLPISFDKESSKYKDEAKS